MFSLHSHVRFKWHVQVVDILYCLFIVVNLLIICINSTGCYYGFVNVEAYTSGLLAVVNVESCLIELKC